MGGGGFMQHASDTNRKDRAQKAARREKFKGNNSDKGILDNHDAQKLDFSHLSPTQITQERARIREKFIKQRRKNLVKYSIAFAVVILFFVWTYYQLFEI